MNLKTYFKGQLCQNIGYNFPEEKIYFKFQKDIHIFGKINSKLIIIS